MVPAQKFQTCQQFSAWNSSYLDHMALPQLEKNYTLPYSPPSNRTAIVGFPGHAASDLPCLNIGDLPCLNIGQQDAVGGFLKPVAPYCNISYPTENAYPKGSQCALSYGFVPQKRFVIFDQSGNHTRLFFSPSLSSRDQISASKTPTSANGRCEEVAAQIDQQFLMKPIVEEKWDENHLSDGEGEMLEDSEEINALLYSDSDGDGDDDDYDTNYGYNGENDEVTSMRHSPYSIEEGYNKTKLLNELTEKAVSSDDSPKRLRLLDGKYKKSSLESFEIPIERAISCSYEDDVESSCAACRNTHDNIDPNKRENKVKIRQALKILESIIPGLDSKDPLSIIDKAVAYLKSMKIEVEALGLGYPRCKSFTSP